MIFLIFWYWKWKLNRLVSLLVGLRFKISVLIGENLTTETLVNFTIKSGTDIPPSPIILHLIISPPPAITSHNIWNKDVIILLHYLCICRSQYQPLDAKPSEKDHNPRPPGEIHLLSTTPVRKKFSHQSHHLFSAPLFCLGGPFYDFYSRLESNRVEVLKKNKV